MLQARVPDSPRDEESSHLAKALEVILWTLMVAVLFLLIGGVLTLPQYSSRWFRIFLAIQGIALPALVFNRRGFLKLSSVWLVAGLWVVITGVVLSGGGLAARGSFAYVIIVFISGFLLGPRTGIVTALICILTVVGLAILEISGNVTSTALVYSPAALCLTLTLFIVIMMSLQYLGSRTIRDALQRTKRELDERRHAEEALIESEARFRTTFEDSGSGIALVDMQGHPVKCNPALQKILGYSEAELVSMSFTEFTHVDDRELDWALYQELTAGKRDRYEIEKRFITKGGSAIWGSLVVSLVRDRDGIPKYAIGMVQDITERKQAEERINLLQMITMDVAAARDFPTALEVVLRRVCDLTGWALGQAWIANPDGSALDCCPASFATIAGTAEFRKLSREFPILPGVGLPGRVWVSRQPAWVRDVTLDANFPRAEAARKNGLKAALGVPILSGDEVIAVLEFYLCEARDEDEHLVKVIAAVAAQIGLVIERKRAEEELRRTSERLRIATKAATIGIWDWDVVKNEVVWDDAMYRIYGLSRQNFSDPYDAWVRSLVPEDLAQATAGVQAALKGEREFAGEFRIVWPDGSVHYTQAASQTYRDETGRAVRMVGVNYDITALKEAEAALRALSESLRRAKEEEGIRIARELHDELGSALTSLKWNLLRLDQVSSSGQGSLPNTSERIAEMVGLVNSTINTVRRISSELRPGVVDDLGLVSAIEWHAQQFEDNTGIVCRFDSNVEDVELDREQATTVFRIFQEAVTNILRHAQATKVIILIEEEEGEFVLEIRDNGRGISPADKLGIRSLGLLGMRERAHSVGGTVEINGTAGKGTVVTVRLPLRKPSDNGNRDGQSDYAGSLREASPRKEES